MIRIKHTLMMTDAFLNRGILEMGSEKPSLLILAFHALIDEESGQDRWASDPCVSHGITVSTFRRCIDYFYYKGYTFVSPADIISGLCPSRRYIMVTFDDGYANVTRALPVLRQYKVPAVFFIVAGNVRSNRSFWWDIIWRERHRQGVSSARILREQAALRSKRAEDIHAYISNLFGSEASSPRGESDRPLTPDELRAFSRERFVHIGNHTLWHTLSRDYTPEQLSAQVNAAQQYLTDITAQEPKIFAYPYGECTESSIRAVKESGIPLAVTLGWRKNYLPLDAGGDGLLKLARFALNGRYDLSMQCGMFRADFSSYGILKRGLGKK